MHLNLNHARQTTFHNHFILLVLPIFKQSVKFHNKMRFWQRTEKSLLLWTVKVTK